MNAKNNYSTKGYKADSPDRDRDYNIIPSGNITMKGVPHPVFGMDETGNFKMMYPGFNYQFPGQRVVEIPVRRYGGKVMRQQGGTSPDDQYQPPQGYTPSTVPQRANWNRFLDYLETKGVAGSADLDARDKKLGLSYLNEYNKANPDQAVPESFIPTAQYESYLIRKKNTFPGLTPQEATYAFANLSQAYKNRPISTVDNWLGSYTTKEYYPEFRRGSGIQKADGTVQSSSYNFGVNFEDYVRSLQNRDLQDKYLVSSNTSSAPSRQVGGPAGKSPDLFWGSAGIAGLSFIANSLEAGDRNRDRQWQRMQGMTDSFAPVVPGSRGDYSVNEGFFRPDQFTPVQFGAMPRAEDGGGFFDSPREFTGLDTPPMADLMGSLPDTAPMPVAERPTRPVSHAPNQATREAYQYYVNDRGLAPHIAAGIVGNLYQESGLKPSAKEKENTGNGRGIAQWDVRDRWPALVRWANQHNRDPYDMKSQLDYILEEPGQSQRVMQLLSKTSSPEEASHVFGKVYERPAEKYARWDVRAGVARSLYDGKFENGGEYTVSPDDLLEILAAGGEVEFI